MGVGGGGALSKNYLPGEERTRGLLRKGEKRGECGGGGGGQGGLRWCG